MSMFMILINSINSKSKKKVMHKTTLFRPVGLNELHLIEESDMTCFPPRLYWQPIFYPVLNEKYASEIAENWNTNDAAGGFAGFVTSFDIPTNYFKQYEVHNVGSAHCNELWVPAEKMQEFNNKILGKIKVIKAYYGPEFKGVKKY